ncbi:MAG: NrpR regulatory domain-containing protein [Candidatus Bathyarchaeia archaeon]
MRVKMVGEYSERKLIEILKVLSEHREPVGARLVANELMRRGFRLDERTVRYHLKILDERGLTENFGYEGRVITAKGLEEIRNALMISRMGFVIAKIESLIYRMDFDIESGKGNVIVNLALVDDENFKEAIVIIKRVIKAGYTVSSKIRILDGGESFGGNTVPQGKKMIFTLCSITQDGILHKAGIPITLEFGGVLQVVNGKPLRFTDAIKYTGTTLDPLDLFATKGLSSVMKAIETGNGQILTNLREIPMDAVDNAKMILQKAERLGIGGVLKIGEPNESIFGVPVGIGRVGIALIGGTNPLAAVSESGIPIQTKVIEDLMPFEEMTHIDEI